MSGRMRRMLRGGRRRRHRKSMRGSGIFDFIRKAHDFIRKHKLVSRIGNTLGSIGVPYAGTIGKAGAVLGYGRKRSRRGGALKLAGAGLGLAGGRKHRRR